MSTSPRIDALLGHLAEQGRELSERSCPQALVDEARRIEVELGQANARIQRLEEAFSYAVNGASAAFDAAGIPPGEFVDRANAVTTRIKRLEQAGDKLSWYSTSKAREEWVKAKEAKP